MNRSFLSEKQRIDHVFALAQALDYGDELCHHMARYLCVLTAGLVEHSVRAILCDYVERHARYTVSSYARISLRRVTNLNDTRLRELLRAFCPDWEDAYEAGTSDAHKVAIDSVMANRHNIAHGRQIGLSMARIREYYARIVETLEWLDGACASD